MHYQFPKIEHLDDVLPAIEGRDEFIVAERDGYKVVNYMVEFEDTFPNINVAGGSAKMREERSLHNTIRRECRGLIFDAHGKIISRRFHKFFNVNQRDETRLDLLQVERPHVVLEKLDGSMISPVVINNKMYWTTKMGITDVAGNAQTYAEENSEYITFATYAINEGMTPVFEWCSDKNRIVVPHAEDKLVLTAIRTNITGEYMSYADMQLLAMKYSIDLVPAHNSLAGDAFNYVQSVENSEGVIIRFDDGHMVKIKSEWYVLRHKSKDAITHEKNVVSYIINDQVDDVLPYLSQDDQGKLLSFQKSFWSELNKSIDHYQRYFDRVPAKMDRKTWAVQHMKDAVAKDSNIQGIVFKMYDGKSAKDILIDLVTKNTGSKTKVENMRHLWNNIKWSYEFDSDV